MFVTRETSSHSSPRLSLSFSSHDTTDSSSPPKSHRSDGQENHHNSTLVSSHAPEHLLGFNLKKGGLNGSAESNGGLTSVKGLSHTVQEIRVKLLQLLEKRGPTFLVSHGCPFSQVCTVIDTENDDYTDIEITLGFFPSLLLN